MQDRRLSTLGAGARPVAPQGPCLRVRPKRAVRPRRGRRPSFALTFALGLAGLSACGNSPGRERADLGADGGVADGALRDASPPDTGPAPLGGPGVYLRGATVLTAEEGAAPREGEAVLVRGDRISSVAPPLPVAGDELQVFDLTGMTLLPGLVDSHVHLATDPPAIAGAMAARLSARRAAGSITRRRGGPDQCVKSSRASR